jgi:hypothetical protein
LSKKTIAFTIPPTARRPRQRKPAVPDAATGETVPLAADDKAPRAGGTASKSDEWVRDTARTSEPSPIADPPPAPPVGVTIDLSAERSLAETMALSVTLPFALGWFWFAHAVAGSQRMWNA